MPFIRRARDKRGYECTFVMHAYRGGNGPSHPRVLYFFRSPSNVKVGRHALDAEVMEALEHTHPDLAFDWPSLQRDSAAFRVDVQDGRERQHRPPRPARRPEPGRPPQPVEPAPPVIEEDESLLGRTVGVRDAARLRQRFEELRQRVLRRARTPEERDRLTERVLRLNPDDWHDVEAIQAGTASFDAEWTAIAEELPHRRRGRRGGRGRAEGGRGGGEASGIINEHAAKGDLDDEATDEPERGASGPSAPVPDSGDRADFGADAGAQSAEAGAGEPAGGEHGPAERPGLPGDDGHHSD